MGIKKKCMFFVDIFQIKLIFSLLTHFDSIFMQSFWKYVAILTTYFVTSSSYLLVSLKCLRAELKTVNAFLDEDNSNDNYAFP